MGQPSSGLLAAAKAGNIDKIYELAYKSSDGGVDDDGDYGDGDSQQADDIAYFWLLIASDFGHAKADSAIMDMHETSSFRYDDDNGAKGLAHIEVAEAYLQGTEGLSVDLERAQEHLETAKELEVHRAVELTKHFQMIRKKLKPEALAVFDAVFPDKKRTAPKPATNPATKKPATKKPKKSATRATTKQPAAKKSSKRK